MRHDTTIAVREPAVHAAGALLASAIGVTEARIRGVLEVCGDTVAALQSRSAAEFERAGLTPRQATALYAVCRVAERRLSEDGPSRPQIHRPSDLVPLLRARLESLPVEEFHTALLDSQHRIIRVVLITRGILNSSLVHPREVFAEAIASRAAAIVVAHNHPSGDPTPSAEDARVTRADGGA